MSNIKLVTSREYFTRVKSKMFLITTLLAPIGLILFYVVLFFVIMQGSDNEKTIAVSDPTNLLEQKIEARKGLTYAFQSEPVSELIKKYEEEEYDGVLEVLPLENPEVKSYSLNYHSDDQMALDESMKLERTIEKKIRNYKLKALDIDEEKINTLQTDVTINPKTVKSDKKITSMTGVISSVVSMVISFLLFFIIILYGQQVMKSVMEEKINRIVEILISTIKPFELMMGKVLGVGLVGLTQIGIWAILFMIVAFLTPTIMGMFGFDPAAMSAESTEMMAGVDKEALPMDKIANLMTELSAINWALILPMALIYFLGGYFMYSSLFAAVGSAVGEDVNEAQTLILPITMIMGIAFYLGIGAARAPDSTLAVWGSILPLISPFVMPARLPFDPPMWQVGLSILVMILTTVFLVWLAARIYRVGILMYGKKASFKELGKWVFYRG